MSVYLYSSVVFSESTSTTHSSVSHDLRQQRTRQTFYYTVTRVSFSQYFITSSSLFFKLSQTATSSLTQGPLLSLMLRLFRIFKILLKAIVTSTWHHPKASSCVLGLGYGSTLLLETHIYSGLCWHYKSP